MENNVTLQDLNWKLSYSALQRAKAEITIMVEMLPASSRPTTYEIDNELSEAHADVLLNLIDFMDQVGVEAIAASPSASPEHAPEAAAILHQSINRLLCALAAKYAARQAHLSTPSEAAESRN